MTEFGWWYWQPVETRWEITTHGYEPGNVLNLDDKELKGIKELERMVGIHSEDSSKG